MTARPPRMDDLLATERAAALAREHGRRAVKEALRRALEERRSVWRAGGAPSDAEALCEAAARDLDARHAPALRPVVNATGVVLHTNLGRAPLPPRLLAEAARVLARYVDLELETETGERGHRDLKVESALQELLGTDHRTVIVNNNAAAVILLLNTLSAGKETVVSRGELVEIGGGFRVPEVMAASGALLREVGATNRTAPEDYAAAVTERTGLLLKVHPSNFRVLGFTREVTPAELAALGRERAVPSAFDLGSGLLLPPELLETGGEMGVREALAAGLDAVCFSADKLLGACQAGVLLIHPRFLQAFRRNPLLRALRADKYTYFLLAGALDLYRRGLWREIPALALLAAGPRELERRARALRRALLRAAPRRFEIEVVRAEGRVGGGAAPLYPLPSPALAIRPAEGSASALEAFLRKGDPPVVAPLSGDRVLLHVRTLLPGDGAAITSHLARYAGPAP